MIKNSTWWFVLYLALMLIVGCNDNRIVEESPEPMTVTGFIPIIYPPEANPAILGQEAVSDEEARKIDIQFSEILVITDDIGYEIKQIDEWRVAHEKVSKILEENRTNKLVFCCNRH